MEFQIFPDVSSDIESILYALPVDISERRFEGVEIGRIEF